MADEVQIIVHGHGHVAVCSPALCNKTKLDKAWNNAQFPIVLCMCLPYGNNCLKYCGPVCVCVCVCILFQCNANEEMCVLWVHSYGMLTFCPVLAGLQLLFSHALLSLFMFSWPLFWPQADLRVFSQAAYILRTRGLLFKSLGSFHFINLWNWRRLPELCGETYYCAYSFLLYSNVWLGEKIWKRSP